MNRLYSKKILMKKLLLFFLLLNIIACQNQVDKTHNDTANDQDIKESGTSFDFLENYPTKNLPVFDSIVVSDYNFEKSLRTRLKEQLQLEKVLPKENLLEQKVTISYRLKISNQFKTIVFHYQNSEQEISGVLVNYDLAYQVVDFKKLSTYDPNNQDSKGAEIIAKKEMSTKRYLYFSDRSEIHFNRYLFSKKGEILDKEYKSLAELISEKKLIHTRVVKAKNGLNIRDSLGNKLSKFDYGAIAYIIEYSKDSTSVQDEGKTIWGRKAKIVMDIYKFMDNLIVPSGEINHGYVFEGFLYKTDGFYDTHDTYSGDKNDPFHYYFTSNTYLGSLSGEDANIDIREILDIEKVDLKDYESKIVAQEKILDSQYHTKDNNEFELSFSNGTSRLFKDTIFMDSEYSPTRHYELFDHNAFENAYLIFHSFFEDSNFILLDKTTGDTLSWFADYPFVSPNKKRVVSITTPFSYGDGESVLELTTMNKNNFHLIIDASFINWNTPNDKYIYWLSDDEFILKVKEVEHSFSDEKNVPYFYLKFNIKV